MLIDWPTSFGAWLDRVEVAARARNEHARLIRRWVLTALAQLQDLPASPVAEEETASLKWVRQSRRYPLWRTSHPFHPEVAVRVICWFPPEQNVVVVVLLAADKARMGDVFYTSVGARADVLIEEWKRQSREKP